MKKVPVFVGLDYHQDSVQVCVLDQAGQVLANRKCANDWREVARAGERCGKVVRAGIEACTGSANLADQLTAHAKWMVDVAHPGYVRRMRGNPDKTDYSDARMLADLQRVGYLPKVWLAPEEIRELRRLVRYRQQLADMRRNTKLRVSALLRDHRLGRGPGSRWTKPWRAWLKVQEFPEHSRWIIDKHVLRIGSLDEEIIDVEKRLEDLAAKDAMIQQLRTKPGIGPVTAWTIRAEIGRFDRFRSGKQLSRFCGLSPRNASSGARQADAGLIQAGNRQLRAVLMQAAHRLMRTEKRWADFACRLLDEGKPKCVVVTAVANRWMRWLYHQMITPAPAANAA